MIDQNRLDKIRAWATSPGSRFDGVDPQEALYLLSAVGELQKIVKCENGHHYEKGTKDSAEGWDGCPVCAMKDGVAVRIESIEIERDTLKARVGELEKALGEEIDNRDRFERQIAWMAKQAGCEKGFSNLHDHSACVRERVGELADSLSLVLPLAKGYAAEHPVGSNQSYVNSAESALGREGVGG